jgi:SAM-dependent methyltransferase
VAYFPTEHWNSEAGKWDDTVANKNFPHYFYYYEADLFIADQLSKSSLALELGAGTCGSTIKHASQNRRIVAIDYSRPMLETGRTKLRSACLADKVDLVIADVCHVPFRNDCFDTVFSRGVAICYASNPEKFVKEARRVLQNGGRLGIDFMNKAGQSKRRISRLENLNGTLYYVEMFSEDGKQKRVGYGLPDGPSLSSKRTEGPFPRGLTSKPDWLKLDGLPREEWWAVLFTPGEARRLLRNGAFKKIRTYPLGCFTRGLKNPVVRDFLIENRDQISAVQKDMADIFRLDKAVHVFLTAVAG